MARTGDLNKGLIKFVFNLEQKPVSKWKSACNESCRSSNKELRSIEFAFFWFFYEFILILQVHYFGNKKEKDPFALRPLEEMISSQLCPWPDVGAGEAAGGRNPAPVAVGGEGEQGDEQEDVERDL